MRFLWVTSAAFLLAIVPAAAFQDAPAGCEKLAHLAIPDTTVSVTRDTSFPEAGTGFCRVWLVSHPVADSEIHVEVWLPDPDRWNGKVLGTGNGGYSGALSYPAMRAALKLGYAVSGSDTGHAGGDLKFGEGHPEKIVDWGYRAVHVMAEAAALVVRNYYGRFASQSYFSGCSTGGHQALSEAQRFPEDYDGIVAGDPGNNRVRLNIGFLWSWQATHASGTAFPASKLPLLSQSVIKACDRLDGVEDGILSDPRACHFDPGALLCKGADQPTCLTPGEVESVRKVYQGARNPRTGEQIYAGWERGSEAGWRGYFVGHPEPARLDFWKLWVFDNPGWNAGSFDYDRDVAYSERKMAATFANNPDLSAFERHGGKLIVYQGWADPVVPPDDTIRYYESVRKKIGPAKTRSFARLFMVPGMGHCGGGPGPDTFDSLGALDAWVTKNEAPDQLLATHVTNGAVDLTRPICAYPAAARPRGAQRDAPFSCTSAAN
ncbi:MAG: tannase/feruloyl esterase family alpha/beta hydrolase [Acidobacteriota bacterium]|nr:tannase/feruloyl esterase family alpha/beta hydrolase [Acidobacteriota bacterium]